MRDREVGESTLLKIPSRVTEQEGRVRLRGRVRKPLGEYNRPVEWLEVIEHQQAGFTSHRAPKCLF